MGSHLSRNGVGRRSKAEEVVVEEKNHSHHPMKDIQPIEKPLKNLTIMQMKDCVDEGDDSAVTVEDCTPSTTRSSKYSGNSPHSNYHANYNKSEHFSMQHEIFLKHLSDDLYCVEDAEIYIKNYPECLFAVNFQNKNALEIAQENGDKEMVTMLNHFASRIMFEQQLHHHTERMRMSVVIPVVKEKIC